MNWVVVIIHQSWRVFFEPQCIHSMSAVTAAHLYLVEMEFSMSIILCCYAEIAIAIFYCR